MKFFISTTSAITSNGMLTSIPTPDEDQCNTVLPYPIKPYFLFKLYSLSILYMYKDKLTLMLLGVHSKVSVILEPSN